MENRYLTISEFEKIFDKNIVPTDLNELLIAVSDVSEYAGVIERRKIQNVSEKDLLSGYQNVSSSVNNNLTWIVELEGFKVSQVLLDEDFFESFCNKASNPNILSKRISLFMDAYSYWTENIYLEAFD